MVYVSQSRCSRTGTPRELFAQVTQFAAQQARANRHSDLDAAAHSVGLEGAQLDQPWAQLSGGQAQRALIAVTLATGPRVLLLGTSQRNPECVLLRSI